MIISQLAPVHLCNRAVIFHIGTENWVTQNSQLSLSLHFEDNSTSQTSPVTSIILMPPVQHQLSPVLEHFLSTFALKISAFSHFFQMSHGLLIVREMCNVRSSSSKYSRSHRFHVTSTSSAPSLPLS